MDRFRAILEPVIFTIGHSTHSIDEFISLLETHGVERLVDIRTVPRSRHNPQFNGDALPATLSAAGIEYEHAPGLGGLRHARKDSVNTGWRNASFRGYADHMQTAEFESALDRLIEESKDRRGAVMCAEAVPWRCHRSLVADALAARGIEVWHIVGPGPARRHEMTPFARVNGNRVTYPNQREA